MNNVMVDLETLGNGSNAVIVAIGAVQFDASGLGHEFYTTVDAESCVAAGLKMDASTVMWWLKQSDAARSALSNGAKLSLAAALAEFSAWFPAKAMFWGNGATFDNVIVSNAYAALRLEKPWGYTSDRCYRTLKAMFPNVKADQTNGVAHNALDDARYQAMHAAKIFNAMKGV